MDPEALKDTDPGCGLEHWYSKFTSFLKDKKSSRSYKAIEIKVFLLFILDDGRIRSRISLVTNGSGCGSGAQNIRILRIRIPNAGSMFIFQIESRVP